MTKSVKRRSMAQQDEVLGFFERLWEVVRRHQRWVLLGLGGVILLFLGVSLTTYLQNQRMQEGRAALAQVRPLLSKPETAAEAVKALDQVLAKYGTTPAAKEAGLYRAHLLYQLKKYPEAAKAYEDAARQLNGRDGLEPFIAESLSYCYEAMGDFNRAAGALVPVATKGAGQMQSELLRRTAWLYEKAGNPAEALRYWKLLLEKPPNPAMISYIQEKVAALSPPAAKTDKAKP